MTELQTPDHVPSPAAAPKGRRRLSAVALVAGGVLAGGVLASTMSAGAVTTDAAPEATTAPEATDESRELGQRGRGYHRTPLDSQTAAQIEAAITEAYPGATVIRMGARPDGTFAAHIVDADDAHVAVALDESFAVTDARELPAPLDADTAAAVEEAVLEEYPGATVIRMGALPEGGYVAHLVTALDEHVGVKLDDTLTVTGELTPDEVRQNAAERLGRLGDRLERGGDHFDRLSERIERLRERLNGEEPAPTDEATAQTSAHSA